MSIRKYTGRWARTAGLCALAIAVAMPALLSAFSDRSDDIDRVSSAALVFRQIMAVPDKAIPDAVIGGAQCIAIIPGDKKFAFGLGGSYGRGVASCRKADGSWSAPLFIALGGGSFGAQIGAESSDIVMVFHTRQELDGMLDTKLRIGAGASAAAGPVGRDVGAATNVDLTGILTYARSKGAFAGINLNGAVITADDSANSRMYGANTGKHAVLTGSVATPNWASGLVSELDRNHVTR